MSTTQAESITDDPERPPLTSAFYLPTGPSRFCATAHTAGPWTSDAQHFGPPSALLTRALEQVPAERPMRLSRITVEILGPAPISELAVEADLARPGRSVELLTGRLTAGDRTVATVSAWRVADADSSAVATGQADPLPSWHGLAPRERPDGWGAGYLDAMEIRPLNGGLDFPGPGAAWMRQRVPLVAGEEPTGLQRLMAAADSGSGLSSLLNPTEWWFINTELTVHLHRDPTGEWMGLDATATIGPDGRGTATTVLHDERGHLGIATQALMVRRR